MEGLGLFDVCVFHFLLAVDIFFSSFSYFVCQKCFEAFE